MFAGGGEPFPGAAGAKQRQTGAVGVRGQRELESWAVLEEAAVPLGPLSPVCDQTQGTVLGSVESTPDCEKQNENVSVITFILITCWILFWLY